MKKFSVKEKVALLAGLTQISWADGKLVPEEMRQLENISTALGFTEQDTEDIQLQAAEFYKSGMDSVYEVLKNSDLRYLMLVAMPVINLSDGRSDAQEEDISETIHQQLNISFDQQLAINGKFIPELLEKFEAHSGAELKQVALQHQNTMFNAGISTSAITLITNFVAELK